MFILDSLMISGIQWALKTVVAAAEAEMNDDSALRDRLLEAEMQREMGEISDDEFREIETDLLKAIREIKERRDGGSGAFAFGGGEPIEAGEDTRFQIEAEVSGDFYGASEIPALDVDRSNRSTRSTGSNRSDRSNRSGASAGTTGTTRMGTTRTRTSRTSRTIRTSRTKK
jgi:hypothetical protein